MENTSVNALLQMLKISKAALRAGELRGRSVVYHRREVLDEAAGFLRENPAGTLVPFGVKNTAQIGAALVERLRALPGWLFHTVDKMAERGRAIDTDLVNPLTGRVMTGSSSASCVHILKGLNDLAIGTDGGGSVLAPALSTGLYAIMAKGLGLKGDIARVSTDRIPFLPGLGVIANRYELCQKAIAELTGIPPLSSGELDAQRIVVALPKRGSAALPDGRDMRQMLEKVRAALSDRVTWTEREFPATAERNPLIAFCQELFREDVDVVLTMEGPVELEGTGDSVLGQWGSTGARLQQQSGKYLLKVANLVDATAVALPAGELAAGLLLLGRPGVAAGRAVIKLGELLQPLYPAPEVFTQYFRDGYQAEDKGFI
ncbi:amidase [Hydrogenispora ethanolica]|jgi:Asp-tRNA(Asn)/Glu-tRNA(Gln) amidotransferase A subunit family amidase|uniref:Amidase n=1 Tax=Hydrogenispora ethanolica TaxID=1082276 RepID=A0A4R1SAV7_HYDET|nr:amidase family protein [Hydrogenispora ethanolica]TCL76509.1 amidase [Hydrogenispora ethanolica]